MKDRPALFSVDEMAKIKDPKWSQSCVSRSQREIVRLARVDAALGDTIGTLEPNTNIHYVSGTMWSTHELLAYALKQTGPARLTLATWSMAEKATVLLLTLLEDGELTGLEMLVDWRVQVRCPKAMALVRQANCRLRVTTCHAKVFILQNAEWAMSLVGSANLTNNPRIEAGVLTTSPEVADFHANWIRAEMENAKPFGVDMRRAYPDGRK